MLLWFCTNLGSWYITLSSFVLPGVQQIIYNVCDSSNNHIYKIPSSWAPRQCVGDCFSEGYWYITPIFGEQDENLNNYMILIALNVIFAKPSGNNITHAGKVAGFSIFVCTEHLFQPLLHCMFSGITWPVGNPTKCPQQESHITAAVQIMNDSETLFSHSLNCRKWIIHGFKFKVSKYSTGLHEAFSLQLTASHTNDVFDEVWGLQPAA